MKRLITATFLLLCLSSAAQKETFINPDSIPLKDGRIFYEQIVTLDSTYTKAMLYANAKLAFVKMFNDAKEVIQIDDKDAGHLVGKGNFQFSVKANFMASSQCRATFLFDVTVKDSKYRLQMYDFTGEIYAEPSSYVRAGWHDQSPLEAIQYAKKDMKYYKRYVSLFDVYVRGLMKSFKEKMINKNNSSSTNTDF